MTPIRCSLATLPIAVAILAAGACRDAAPAANASAPPSSEAPRRTPGHVRLDTSQIGQVRIEELSAHAAADAIKVTGTFEFNADRTAKLLAPVSGQVQNLAVNVGDTVKKNAVLFVLSSREVAAAVAERVNSQKDLELAEKTFAMTTDLYQHQAASRMALQQSEAELAKARSKVTQAEENLRVLGFDPHADEDASRVQPRIPVRTPIDGTVIERTITNGQFVGSESTPLITIADLSSVWVQGDVFERDLRHIAVGEKADVITAAYPDDRFVAEVSRIASVVDAQTRTAKVRFLVANPGERLKPGMYATISVHVSSAHDALTIPASAVFVENGRTFAYVQTGPQEFVRRSVQTVASGSGRSRVLGGVAAGDRVVTDGVLLLRQVEADAAPQ